MSEKIKLYTINKNVRCLKCGNIGAVKPYGKYNEENEQMSCVVGFGGTIPHSCMNCGNTGLVNMDGLEGYKKAFEIIMNELDFS
jgi:hypothetical protein